MATHYPIEAFRKKGSEDFLGADGDSTFAFDFRTFLVVTALVGFGLISIYSATYDSGASQAFYSQLIFAVIGLALMVGVAFVPVRWIRESSWPVYVISVALSGAVLFFGTEVNNARAWFVIGPFSFQPSELAKLGTLLAAASFISSEKRDLRTVRDVFLLGLIVVVPMGLILKEDMGSATVFAAMLLGLLLWAGADMFLVFTITAAVGVSIAALFGQTALLIALGATLVIMIFFRKSILMSMLAFAMVAGVGFATAPVYESLPSYQRSRFEVILDNTHDPQGVGYNLLQSILAIGSGGVTGKGFLQGTQTQLRYVPEQYTDFIFCVPTEEFGFVGGVIVIGLLTALVFFAANTAFRLRDAFESTVAFGIAMIFFFHMMVNIGMTMGLVPVMGIPLPFLSKGGSSLVINLVMVGILLNFFRYRADVRRS